MLNSEEQYALNVRISNAIALRTSSDLALGWLRYETLRKLNAQQYRELFCHSLIGPKSFDDLVDELFVKGAK